MQDRRSRLDRLLGMAIALVEPLNASMKGYTTLVGKAEEAIKAIDALLFSPAGGHAL